MCGGNEGSLYLDGEVVWQQSRWDSIYSLLTVGADRTAIGMKDGRLCFWSIGKEPELVASAGPLKQNISLTALGRDSSGDWLVGAGNTICRLPLGHHEFLQCCTTTSHTHALVHWREGDAVFAGGRYEDILVLDALSLKPKGRLENGSGCSAFVLDNDSATLFSAHWDSTIRAWDLQTGRQKAILRGHDSGVLSLSLHPSKKVLASASHDGTVRLWSVDLCQEYGVIARGTRRASCVRFSDDGHVLAAAFLGADSLSTEVRVWDVGRP